VIAAFRERFNKAPPPNQFKIYIESEVRIFWVYGDFSATLYMSIYKYQLFSNKVSGHQIRPISISLPSIRSFFSLKVFDG